MSRSRRSMLTVAISLLASLILASNTLALTAVSFRSGTSKAEYVGTLGLNICATGIGYDSAEVSIVSQTTNTSASFSCTMWSTSFKNSSTSNLNYSVKAAATNLMTGTAFCSKSIGKATGTGKAGATAAVRLEVWGVSEGAVVKSVTIWSTQATCSESALTSSSVKGSSNWIKSTTPCLAFLAGPGRSYQIRLVSLVDVARNFTTNTALNATATVRNGSSTYAVTGYYSANSTSCA